MKLLSKQELENLYQPYLLFGHREDQIHLEKFLIDKNILIATLKVDSVFF